MKWQKVQKHYSYWWIKDYPFFRTNIYYQDYFTKIYTYKKYVYGNNIFDTLQDAMIFVQKKVEIACKEYLKTGNKLHEISISDSVWPNNAGGALKHESFNPQLNFNRITNDEFTTSAPLLQNRCYA